LTNDCENKKGTSFRGVLDYLEAKVDKGHGERIGGNMYGVGARQLAAEFGISRSLRPNLTRAVHHVSLNLAPEENATNEEFLKMVDIYLNEMGFNDCQFVAYRHFDRKHHHTHLVISRISLNGEVISEKGDFARNKNVMRKLEKEFGLTQINDSNKATNKQYSKGQIERLRRTGEVPIQAQLQQILSSITSNKLSLNEFINELSSYGVNVNFHHNKDKVFGISYELDGVAFKGSSLGKGYTWNAINQKIDYEHERDFELIRAASAGRTTENTRGTGREASTNEHNEHQRTQGVAIANSGISKKDGVRSSGRRPETQQNYPEMARNAEKSKPIAIEAGGNSTGDERNAGTNNMENAIVRIHPVTNSQCYNSNRDEDDLELLKRKKKKKRPRPSQDFEQSR